MIQFGSGTSNSVIDNNNRKIVLRAQFYPRGILSVEWVITDSEITVNRSKKRGARIETGVIQYCNISSMDYTVGIQQSSVTIMLRGKTPKKWYSGLASIAGVDMFIAYEAYKFILNKCQNELKIPIAASIPSYIPEGAEKLQSGRAQIEEPDFVGTMKARGITWERFGEPAPPLISAPEIFAAQSPPAQSVADELLKLKNLVDMGILTQEEFEHKKRILLGL